MSTFYTPGVYFCIWPNKPEFYYINYIENNTVSGSAIKIHCILSNDISVPIYTNIYAKPDPKAVAIRLANTPDELDLPNIKNNYSHLFI